MNSNLLTKTRKKQGLNHEQMAKMLSYKEFKLIFFTDKVEENKTMESNSI